MKKLLFALACVGCLDTAEDPTDSIDQAINGETWATVDDNPYTEGTGATTTGVAISPLTHKVLVTGSRHETNGTTTAIVRGSTNGTTFALNSTFKALATGSSVATAVAADSLGYWYVAGTYVDAGNVTHWIVRKSTDDGMSWTKVFDEAGHVAQDVPLGISVDSAGNVWLAGTYFGNNSMFAEVIRGANRGATWAMSDSWATLNHDNGFSSTCEGLYNGQSAEFAVGWQGSATDTYVRIDYTLDHGTTWHASPVGYAILPNTHANGCATDAAGDLDVATYSFATNPSASYWDGTVWKVATDTPLNEDQLTTGTATLGTGAYGAAHAGASEYFVGQVNNQWWTRRLAANGGQTSRVTTDIYAYPGASTGESRAVAAAYDSVRGLYVVGRAHDSAGREHGIVRHRN